jgi:hypothetical protein
MCWEGCGGKRSWPNLMYNLGIWLGGLSENHENFSHDSLCHGRNSNRAPLVSTLRWKVQLPSFTLRMKAVHSSESSIFNYNMTRQKAETLIVMVAAARAWKLIAFSVCTHKVLWFSWNLSQRLIITLQLHPVCELVTIRTCKSVLIYLHVFVVKYFS